MKNKKVNNNKFAHTEKVAEKATDNEETIRYIYTLYKKRHNTVARRFLINCSSSINHNDFSYFIIVAKVSENFSFCND